MVGQNKIKEIAKDLRAQVHATWTKQWQNNGNKIAPREGEMADSAPLDGTDTDVAADLRLLAV